MFIKFDFCSPAPYNKFVASEQIGQIGLRIRYLRRQAGMTLRALSKECGLSTGFLSQIERGLSSFSIPSLQSICQALDVPVADMLVVSNDPGKAYFADPRPSEIIKGDNRSFVKLSDTSIKYRFLTVEFPGRRFDAFISEMSPSYHVDCPIHEGEEFAYVLDGRLQLTLSDEKYELASGDTFHLMGTTPHVIDVGEEVGAKVLWVQTTRFARALVLLGAKESELYSATDDIPTAFPGVSNSEPHVQLSKSSVSYQFLSGSLPEGQLRILIAEIPPGYHEASRSNVGEEFGYVLEGKIRLMIDEESYVLGHGDCYHFPATTPHGYTIEGDAKARLLLVSSVGGGDNELDGHDAKR
jgi:quercetin dioxygenase-like cupin family protein/DNA-binding XRE family transcriptional regulator